MRTCQHIDEYGKKCGRTLKTGRKYCYEHRNATHDPIDLAVYNATESYKKNEWNKAYVYLCICFVLLLIPFVILGSYLNQFVTAITIGIFVSLILSFFICIKYLKITFNPQKRVDERHPDYVKWVEKRVKKPKSQREFGKSIVNR